MPHKHKPRHNKAVRLLLEAENDELIAKSLFEADRENLVRKLDSEEKRDIHGTIYNRWMSADGITCAAAEKMAEMDRLYYGIFEKKPREGQTYLNKTRENLKAINAYILQLVSQLDPIVTCLPKNFTSIHAATEEFRRAKVMEALLNYYFNTLWNFRDDVFPLWLKHFLKYSLAIYKVSYKEDNHLPDLNISVIDRAFLRVDPFARDIKHAKWVCETQFISRSEVYEMAEQGYWELTDDEIMHLPASQMTQDSALSSNATRNRFLNEGLFTEHGSVNEDDLIEVVHYWQAPGKGLDDVYAAFIGGMSGVMGRYGRNPFPYKGIPYRAKSFDPNETILDGTGYIEEFKPIQRLINNLFELRNKDIQNNVLNRKIVSEHLFDEQTMEDWEAGHHFVRGNKEFFDQAINDPNFDPNKYIIDLGVRTSTDNLVGVDLQFILDQGKENSFISDVFRGQAGAANVPYSTSREALIRNQGAFRPVYMQVARCFTEIAEIMTVYLQSPEFFATDRIIQVIGKNKYTDVIQGWHNPSGSNVFIREVTPDEMDVDVTIDAVSGADAIASKSITNNAIAEILQALGQIPGAFEKLQETKDISKLFDIMVENIGADIDMVNLTPQEQQKRKMIQEQEIKRQQQMLIEQQMKLAEIDNQKAQFQAQLESQKQVAIQDSRARAQIQIDNSKQQGKFQEIAIGHKLDMENMITEIMTKVTNELKAKLVLMDREAVLERQNQGISVGHDNNVSQ